MSAQRAIAWVERIEGDRDALRFGVMRFSGNHAAPFTYDLLSGRVFFTRSELAAKFGVPEPTPEEAEAATAVLHALIPPIAEADQP